MIRGFVRSSLVPKGVVRFAQVYDIRLAFGSRFVFELALVPGVKYLYSAGESIVSVGNTVLRNKDVLVCVATNDDSGDPVSSTAGGVEFVLRRVKFRCEYPEKSGQFHELHAYPVKYNNYAPVFSKQGSEADYVHVHCEKLRGDNVLSVHGGDALPWFAVHGASEAFQAVYASVSAPDGCGGQLGVGMQKNSAHICILRSVFSMFRPHKNTVGKESFRAPVLTAPNHPPRRTALAVDVLFLLRHPSRPPRETPEGRRSTAHTRPIRSLANSQGQHKQVATGGRPADSAGRERPAVQASTGSVGC